MALAGLVAGPLLAVAAYLVVPGEFAHAGEAIEIGRAGRVTAAVAVLMATWWLTEALPLSATALLPLALLPMLGGPSMREVAAPYASPVIFLFLGGFMLGLAMERWGLHRRIALRTLLLFGSGPRAIVAGFMLATAVLSAFVSNTATVIMMLPIATSVLGSLALPGGDADRGRFATCLVLAIAYAASIGGVATLIGTPPNGVLRDVVLTQTGVPIDFGRWMLYAAPLVAIMLPLTYVLLVGPLFRVRGGVREAPESGRAAIRRHLDELGPMAPGEWVVLVVFGLAAALWIFKKPLLALPPLAALDLRLDDAQIAMLAAVALFAIPVDRRARTFALDWRTAARAPFGVLLLFGGGLSLAAAIQASGLDRVIGGQFALLQGLPPWTLILAVCLLVTFLTELTSNTATTTALLPVVAAAAPVVGVDPAMLMLPAAVSASCAFMLPVATPPNAVAFASGHVAMPQMVRAGLVLNLTMAPIVTTWVLLGATGVVPAGDAAP